MMRLGVRSGKLNPVLLMSLIANLALLAGGGYYWYTTRKPKESSGSIDSSTSTEGKKVAALGRIQPANGLIAVFGVPGEKVKSVASVRKTVKVGDQLAELSGDDERLLNLKTLAAQIKEAEALKAAIEASLSAKLADLEAETNQATAGLAQDTKVLDAKERAASAQAERARADLKRLTEVKADGVAVSKQEFESVNALLATAEAEMAVAVAQKEKLKVQKEQSNVSIVAKKAAVKAEAERALAQVPLASLISAKAVAELKVQDSKVTAPVAGEVIEVLSRVGDTLSNRPILQIADTSKLVVAAEVYETDVSVIRDWVKKHGSVDVVIETRVLSTGADDKKLKGRVTGVDKVGMLISRNSLTPLGPREDADRRVMSVEVELDPEAVNELKNFIGLQVRTSFAESPSGNK